jgi:DNA repair protein RadC
VNAIVRELRITYEPKQFAGPLPHLSGPAAALDLVRARLEVEPVEVCLLLLVNTRHRLLAIQEIGRGSLDSCVVHPREVFKAAIVANAAGVIVAHNHPSGDPTPSPDDIALCDRLRNAATILGIELLDFLIIGDGRHFSFKEAGL